MLKKVSLLALQNLFKRSHCVPIGEKFCWGLLENFGDDVSKFHQLLSDNRDTAASAGVEDKVGLLFESLRLKCRDRMNQMINQPYPVVQPEDSASNVGTALSRSSAIALTQIDLELQREELQIEAQKFKRKCKRNSCKPNVN